MSDDDLYNEVYNTFNFNAMTDEVVELELHLTHQAIGSLEKRLSDQPAWLSDIVYLQRNLDRWKTRKSILETVQMERIISR